MNPHRALIVDDERLARRELAYLLADHPEIEVAAEAGSVGEAAAALERLRPELLFLDIQMPGESGFDLFERARVTARVIFVTAHDQFALRAFEVNALDYLMKPVNPARLRVAVDRFLGRGAPPPGPSAGRINYDDSVFVTIDQAPRFIAVASIACILAEGDYTRLISTTGPIGLVLKPMKEWEQLLPERHFARIQRSAIVNCAHVARFEPWFNGAMQVHLKALPEPLTMSRRYARQFRAKFAV
ncbi:LytR/AlgR family response regulator transcription factor [Opitutus terrae]|uniref:Two component transcriptional regulator, LytTR family n=1 Tax=Opitutus terrae (strain DSM 11246 / JCM 15787 / PB90-1) TaxID=452637 RepID=B1ZXP5_OPITP|nr:LytTR family DNA-binding domain-containing protein [Opitutus terrae]ACB74267.1 two component transcriptional regulator, LytTR family [Opitutus terrae PB90-1]